MGGNFCTLHLGLPPPSREPQMEEVLGRAPSTEAAEGRQRRLRSKLRSSPLPLPVPIPPGNC